MTVDKIKEIKCFILDMDGTIYLGNELFDFTKDFLNKVEETGREYYFFTNNSSKSQQAYIDKLGNMGIHIEPKQMMISSHVMIKYLKEKHPGETIYVVGTPSLINEFKTFNMPLVDENPDIVILGFDTTLTYEKISKAWPLYKKWLYILRNQPRLELSNGRWYIYSRLRFHGQISRSFYRKIPGILWKTI